MIYTSYFANLRNLPKEIIPVSICGKAPDWYTGAQYKKLAPKYWFFKEWKENHDNDFYIQNFEKEVLNPLDAKKVLWEIAKLLPDDKPVQDIVLLCYEKPADFCHRHLVADWLRKNGIACKEFEKGE